MLTIDIDTARRFILGKQGLWPGRRWRGLRGTEQAMRAMEYLQLDPLQIVARSHDIKLYGRVLDYMPGMWENVTYSKRKFFDWGGWRPCGPWTSYRTGAWSCAGSAMGSSGGRECPGWPAITHKPSRKCVPFMRAWHREE
jgi:hypothetical protein